MNYPGFVNAEFSFIVDCVRRLLDQNVDLESRVGSVRDWPLLLQIINHHQILPIVYNTLCEPEVSSVIPLSVKQALNRKRQLISQRNMQMTAETLRILTTFRDAGIRTLPLKGTILSADLYGQNGLRQARDIDLFIDPRLYALVGVILKRLGYQYFYPKDADLWKDSAVLKFLVNFGEMTWLNPQSKVLLDIHVHLCGNENFLGVSFEQARASASSFSLKLTKQVEKQISILSEEHQVLFLCAHGAKHKWSKLLWLIDLSLLLGKSSTLEIDWNHIYWKAKSLDIERPIVQGLTLIEQIFHLENPMPWREICKSKIVQRLAHTSRVKLESMQLSSESGSPPMAPKLFRDFLPDLNYKMKLKKGIGYKLDCFRKYFYSVNDSKIASLAFHIRVLFLSIRYLINRY